MPTLSFRFFASALRAALLNRSVRVAFWPATTDLLALAIVLVFLPSFARTRAVSLPAPVALTFSDSTPVLAKLLRCLAEMLPTLNVGKLAGGNCGFPWP